MDEQACPVQPCNPNVNNFWLVEGNPSGGLPCLILHCSCPPDLWFPVCLVCSHCSSNEEARPKHPLTPKKPLEAKVSTPRTSDSKSGKAWPFLLSSNQTRDWGGCFILETERWICPDICPGVGLLDHMVVLHSVFWGTSMLLSIASAPSHTPTNPVGGFPFLHALSSSCYL